MKKINEFAIESQNETSPLVENNILKYNNTRSIKDKWGNVKEWVTTDEVLNVEMTPFKHWTGEGWTSYLNISGSITISINKNDFKRDELNYIQLKSNLLTDVVRVERRFFCRFRLYSVF